MASNRYHQKDISATSFLITGGAGFIGSNLVTYLVKHKAGRIVVLDNLSTGYLANIKEFLDNQQIEFIHGDIRDLSCCNQAMRGVDYVLHQAALGSVPRSINDPITTNEVNVMGFLNVLHAAKEADVKRFVYAASSSTYGDSPSLPKKEDVIGNPLSPYAVTKYVNELYADVYSRTYNFNSVGLRYFNVFGPKQNINGPYAAVIPLFITQLLKGESPSINGDGSTSRDFTFVDNVVQANMKAMFADTLRGHEVFNVACNEQTSLTELVSAISSELGSEVKPTYKLERKGDVKHSLADISKARTEIGYQPDILFKDGLKETIAFFKNHLNSY
jgi:UDP-N-acetylglucosamine 4-epimerase